MRLNHEEQERIYSNYWVCIEQDCVLSKSNESKVSDFIRDYLTIENKKIPKKGNVYAEFKAKYHSLHALDLDTVLTPIKRFANHYHKLINPESEPDREIRKELTSINRLEITVAYPFLLHIYDDYANRDIEKALFIEILKCIESFLFRRFITGLEARELNKIFMNLYEKVDRADYLYSIQRALVRRGGEQRFPTDEEVSNALRSKDMYTIKERKRYILDKLENHRNKEKVIIQDNADITIEHIFPQNPDKEWEKTLDKEEYKFMKEKLHTIGNLTLSGNNGALGNKSFQEKRDLKDKGYKDSRLWLNRYLASIDAWNRETLEKRFDMIKDRFLEIWAYPSIRPDDVPAERETSLFAIDPTHRKFEYIIFRGEKKEICTMTELYREVVKQLFESRQDTFFTTDLMETVSLTRKEDKAKLNSSLEISDTWFIEGGMSSKDKQSKIKKIASAFGLEDDEILVSLSPAVP
jgi:hypothetical protein